MGLARTPLAICISTTVFTLIALWVPLEMQSIVARHNEGCFGPFTDEDYRALLTVRLQTWAGSLVVSGISLAALIWIDLDRRWASVLTVLFFIWKTAALGHDIFASPVCWEPYENDTPFWDEPAGLDFIILLQPVGFLAFSFALIALTASKWWAFIAPMVKNRLKRGK